MTSGSRTDLLLELTEPPATGGYLMTDWYETPADADALRVALGVNGGGTPDCAVEQALTNDSGVQECAQAVVPITNNRFGFSDVPIAGRYFRVTGSGMPTGDIRLSVRAV